MFSTKITNYDYIGSKKDASWKYFQNPGGLSVDASILQNCRYGGGIIQDSFISRLMPYVEFLTV